MNKNSNPNCFIAWPIWVFFELAQAINSSSEKWLKSCFVLVLVISKMLEVKILVIRSLFPSPPKKYVFSKSRTMIPIWGKYPADLFSFYFILVLGWIHEKLSWEPYCEWPISYFFFFWIVYTWILTKITDFGGFYDFGCFDSSKIEKKIFCVKFYYRDLFWAKIYYSHAYGDLLLIDST